MSESKLIELGYYDPSAKIRLSAYADTVVLDPDKKGSVICAIRFGGYPEMVRAMADAIYGGATIEATQNGMVRKLQSKLKGYQRQITHDGVYAVATLMAADDAQEETSLQDEDGPEDDRQKGDEEAAPQKPTQPRKCYIFCPEGDRARLFEELDHKTAAPLIPAFQDYVLTSLQNRGDLRQLEVVSQKERIDAWVLTLKPEDKNVVEVLEEGLKTGDIQIPGAVPGFSDGFENVTNVTEYLNAFGVTVADRIRNQFMPLFDPASEPLSDEVLAINDFITQHAGYSLYDAQLAVAEAVKRQLERKRAALIIAECGSGKTKIGSTALGALHGLWASQKKKDTGKSFNIIMCPSHVTKKWVREIGETLPDIHMLTRGAGVAAAVIVLSTVTANALGFHPIHAILQWAEGIVQVCINPSGTMELPDSTPSEYHSLAEALAQNGIDATGLPTWIPRDYSIYSITSKVSDGIVKCVAEFESNRGDLMMRVTSYAMENTIAVEERDESSRCYSKGNVDYYIISNNDQVKISWQIGLNAYVIGGQISENEAKEIIDSIT